ncbi:MAG: sigma-54-dependent Fis family transcriptional regulator [Sedimentisphaerales bacterium]|nr:sigma-54-dependent Fis family transcriptional regulator [Sedimentisphaerales bacterium]
MLMRVLLALPDARFQARLQERLRTDQVVVDVAPRRGLSWRSLSQAACDLLIADRELAPARIPKRLLPQRDVSKTTALVIITHRENAIERAGLIAAGCDAVLCRDLPLESISDALQAVLDKRRLMAEAALRSRRDLGEPSLKDFVSRSPVMKEFLRIVRQVVKSNSALLILGETGVGKERLAHAIHAEGARASGPFVPVNCGALPETLLESELFGHEKGAFTGATQARRGCFEMAHKGTLFLDEIAEMPLHLQVKLLSVLETKQIRPIGGESFIPVDVRIMAATNRDIENEVEEKRFRQDLYYRLNVVTLTIPPLSERREDIPELVENYLAFLRPRIGCEVMGICPEALDLLCQYSWPGNVRELINVIERAMLLCESDTITQQDLPSSVTGQFALPALPLPAAEVAREFGTVPREWLKRPLKQASRIVLEQFEYRYLTGLLQETNGRIRETARRARIDERTLFSKMKRYGLHKETFRES